MIGVLMDDTDPLVTVMKVEKAPQETYADIGGLDNQIQEIKVHFTQPESQIHFVGWLEFDVLPFVRLQCV